MEHKSKKTEIRAITLLQICLLKITMVMQWDRQSYLHERGASSDLEVPLTGVSCAALKWPTNTGLNAIVYQTRSFLFLLARLTLLHLDTFVP